METEDELLGKVAANQRLHLQHRAKRDQLIRQCVARGLTMYKVAKAMEELIGPEDALSQSMIREIISPRPRPKKARPT